MTDHDDRPNLRIIHQTCSRCGQQLTGGSHWHCAGCDSTETTSMYGHHTALCRYEPHGTVTRSRS